MELTILSKGIFGSNTFIAEDGKECAIIDCGNRPEDILRIVDDKNLHVRYIILTHGHVDHAYYAAVLKDATDSVLCLHEDELELYSDYEKNGYALFGFQRDVRLVKPDRLLKHGDKLPLGDTFLEIIHTPGHSPGSISILWGNMLMSGDTLFQSSVGRTDFYGGSAKQLAESIRNHLFTLDGKTTVYPGHGPSTTIAFERENNPYV